MPIYKRIEIWILLVLVCAGIGVVFFTQDRDGESGGDVTESPEESDESLAFTVRSASIHPEGPLEVKLLYRNEAEEEIDLESAARVLNQGGGELRSFFLAFASPPVIPAGEEREVTLRYQWNEADGTELTLVIGEEEAPIQLPAESKRVAEAEADS